MKKLFSLLPLVLLLVLSACTNSDVPSGMQVAADGSNGYRVFVPMNWVFHDSGTRLTSYVSAVDTTGVVLSYTDLAPDDSRTSDAFFADGIAELSALSEFKEEQRGTLPIDGVSAPFLVYTFRSGEYLYRSESLYIVKAGRCYAVSFTSRDEQFASYQSQLDSILQYLAFNENRTPESRPSFADDTTPEGMKLASHPDIADYRLYVPESFLIERATSDSLVSVSESDRSSLSVFPTVPRESTLDEYLVSYKAELAKIYTDLVFVEESKEAVFGDRSPVFMMEFTGRFEGESYRVRQYMMTRGYYLYIFTYTAKDSDAGDGVTYFEKNLPAMEAIYKAFRFDGEA